MHTNVHCSTLYNSKDLESTQMPIDDRLDKENVAHIHHGIVCSHKKQWVCVICRDMNEPGNHHCQQTDTRTENQTPHVLTHSQVLNNENTWTQGGGRYILGSVGGNRGGTVRGGELGRDSMGRNARYMWRGGRQQITLPRVYLCNYLACSSHVPQNLKCNLKKNIAYCWRISKHRQQIHGVFSIELSVLNPFQATQVLIGISKIGNTKASPRVTFPF